MDFENTLSTAEMLGDAADTAAGYPLLIPAAG